MRYYKLLFLWGFIVLLGGCALGPDKRDAPMVFDLGAPPVLNSAKAQRVNASLMAAPVAASPWLDTTNIYYRFAQRNAIQPDAYAQHRWTQSPAVMITERMRARLAMVTRGVVTPLDGAKTDYALRVELEDFSQVFTSEQASQVHTRLRASLVDGNTRVLRAQKTFAASRPAEPNAPGAARALASATDAVIEEMTAWVIETLK